MSEFRVLFAVVVCLAASSQADQGRRARVAQSGHVAVGEAIRIFLKVPSLTRREKNLYNYRIVVKRSDGLFTVHFIPLISDIGEGVEAFVPISVRTGKLQGAVRLAQ